jgi:peptidoglycan/xylan/chitin deacetylase (PgdA/CDA1 family)
LQITRGQVAAIGSLILVAAAAAVIVLDALPGSSTPQATSTPAASRTQPRGTSSASRTPARPGTASVPILVYHVINARPAGSSADPALYVPADEFSSQMEALKANGWHSVTLDQIEAYWTRGASLGPGKPIVITFDNGYASQYTNALPVLKRLGWPGVENLELAGLPPSEGGLTDAQIRGLIAAGWELDTQGMSHADLTGLDAARLTNEVATARQTLHGRYGVPANWFSYPSGDYDATVIDAVRAAGYLGATTVNPGWASPQQDRFRLPRLVVTGGTAPSQLLAQIASTQNATAVPAAYNGPGLA